MAEQKWLLHWWYDDGSASGVLPRILTDDDKKLLELADRECGFAKSVEYVKVPMKDSEEDHSYDDHAWDCHEIEIERLIQSLFSELGSSIGVLTYRCARCNAEYSKPKAWAAKGRCKCGKWPMVPYLS